MSSESEFREYASRILWQDVCHPTQVCILLALKMNPTGLTTKDFACVAGLSHRRTFQRNVDWLVNRGLVEAAPEGAYGLKRYTLTERGNDWHPLPSDRGKA